MKEKSATLLGDVNVDDLTLQFGSIPSLSNLSLEIGKGRIMGVVGESGSGKTTLARAILGLLPNTAQITSGSILFCGVDLAKLPPKQMRILRGDRITYVSQDPLRALTPTLTIGDQMTDIQYRSKVSMDQKRSTAIEFLNRVGIPNPNHRFNMYPHQLSGGQRQRVSIAMAVMMKPNLLIADEATTALDATLELEIIKLLKSLQSEIGCSMLFITHHLGVVASLCDDVAVMHKGKICEQGKVVDVLQNPKAKYTKTLLRCDPAWIKEKTRRLLTTQDDPDTPISIETGPPDRIKKSKPPILDITDLNVTFRNKTFFGDIFGATELEIHAVKDVNLQIRRGETVAVVGESGSGKTTLARTVIGLQVPDSGSIKFDRHQLFELSSTRYKEVRREISYIFQDPVGALDPRMRIREAVLEPLRIHGIKVESYRNKALELLNLVGLDSKFLNRYPHEISGGQARRVGVARAIAMEPKLIIADELTAGLDVSIQGEVLNLLAKIQDETGVSVLLITHNLNVVRHISDRVAIMYMGDILEFDETENIFGCPKHDYTRKLIDANVHPNFSCH